MKVLKVLFLLMCFTLWCVNELSIKNENLKCYQTLYNEDVIERGVKNEKRRVRNYGKFRNIKQRQLQVI